MNPTTYVEYPWNDQRRAETTGRWKIEDGKLKIEVYPDPPSILTRYFFKEYRMSLWLDEKYTK